MKRKEFLITDIKTVQIEPHDLGWGVRFTLECCECQTSNNFDFIEQKDADTFGKSLEKGILLKPIICKCNKHTFN